MDDMNGHLKREETMLLDRTMDEDKSLTELVPDRVQTTDPMSASTALIFSGGVYVWCEQLMGYVRADKAIVASLILERDKAVTIFHATENNLLFIEPKQLSETVDANE